MRITRKDQIRTIMANMKRTAPGRLAYAAELGAARARERQEAVRKLRVERRSAEEIEHQADHEDAITNREWTR